MRTFRGNKKPVKPKFGGIRLISKTDEQVEEEMRKKQQLEENVDVISSGRPEDREYKGYEGERDLVSEIINKHYEDYTSENGEEYKPVVPHMITITRIHKEKGDKEKSSIPLRLAHYIDGKRPGEKDYSDIIPHVRGIIVDIENRVVVLCSMGKNTETVINQIVDVQEDDIINFRENTLYFFNEGGKVIVVNSDGNHEEVVQDFDKNPSEIINEDGVPSFEITPDYEGITLRVFMYKYEDKQHIIKATYKNLFAFDTFRVTDNDILLSNNMASENVTVTVTLETMYARAGGPKVEELFYRNLSNDFDGSATMSEGDKEKKNPHTDKEPPYCYHFIIMSPIYSRVSYRPIGGDGYCVLADITLLETYGKDEEPHLPPCIFVPNLKNEGTVQSFDEDHLYHGDTLYQNPYQEYVPFDDEYQAYGKNQGYYGQGYGGYQGYYGQGYGGYQGYYGQGYGGYQVAENYEKDRYGDQSRYTVDEVFGSYEERAKKFKKLLVLPGVENVFIDCVIGDTKEKRKERFAEMIKESMEIIEYPYTGGIFYEKPSDYSVNKGVKEMDIKAIAEKSVKINPILQTCDKFLIRERRDGKIVKIHTIFSPSYKWRLEQVAGDNPRSVINIASLFMNKFEDILKGKYDVRFLKCLITDGTGGGIFDSDEKGEQIFINDEYIKDCMIKNREKMKKVVYEYPSVGNIDDVSNGPMFLVPEDVITIHDRFKKLSYKSFDNRYKLFANAFATLLISLSPYHQEKVIDRKIYNKCLESIQTVSEFIYGTTRNNRKGIIGSWNNPVRATNKRDAIRSCRNILKENSKKNEKGNTEDRIIEITPLMKIMFDRVSQSKSGDNTTEIVLKSLVSQEGHNLYKIWMAAQYYKIYTNLCFYMVKRDERKKMSMGTSDDERTYQGAVKGFQRTNKLKQGKKESSREVQKPSEDRGRGANRGRGFSTRKRSPRPTNTRPTNTRPTNTRPANKVYVEKK